MKRHPRFEQCERRDLLAADLQAWHDPAPVVDPPAEPGDEVTRVIRIYNNGDEPALAEINSSLTAELEDPTWYRQPARGRAFQQASDIVHGRSKDFSVDGLAHYSGLKEIGDVNGDGKQDFGFVQANRGVFQVHLMLGGLNDGGGVGERTVKVSFRGTSPGSLHLRDISALGDLDGDGFDDIAIRNFVVWGHAGIRTGAKLYVGGQANRHLAITDARSVRGVGDVNGDTRPDVVVHADRESWLVFGSEQLRQRGELSLTQWTADIPKRTLQGAATLAGPAGDLNADGHGDFVVARRPSRSAHSPVTTVLFGGPALSAEETLSLDELAADAGFHVSNLIDATIHEFDDFAVQAHSAGDVDGDGVDDLLVGFNGSICNAGCNVSTATSRSGAILILGNEQVGRGGQISDDSPGVYTYQLSAPYESTHFPRLVNANSDGRLDLHFYAAGKSHIVFGSEQLTSRRLYGRAQAARWLTGDDGFVVNGQVDFVDIDGDSTTDLLATMSPAPAQPYLHTVDVYLDAIQSAPAPRVLGAGDVAEVLPLPAGTSVVYTVTGRLRQQPEGPIVTRVAAQAATSGTAAPENLLDNTAGTSTVPLIGVEVRAESPLDAGQAAAVEVTIRNAGPDKVSDLMISESITDLFAESEWSRQTQLFPATVPRELVGQMNGFQLTGGTGGDQSIPHRMDSVRQLGDVNGDGFRDITIGTGRVVLGGADFGKTGSLDSGEGQLLVQYSSSSVDLYRLGDINGDGIDDIAGRDWSSGRWHVIWGDASWMPGGRVSSIRLDAENSVALHSDIDLVYPAGDLDGDGKADFAVRAHDRHYTLVGLPDPVQTLQSDLSPDHGMGMPSSQQTGPPIIPLGDVDADGYADALVRWQGRRSDAYLLFGGPDTRQLSEVLAGRFHWSRVSSFPGVWLPGEVFTSGDINGDGVVDVVVDSSTRDAGYVLYGSQSLSDLQGFNAADLNDGERGFRWKQTPASDLEPSNIDLPKRQVTAVADVNGDGFDDLVSGHGRSGCPMAGPLYVYYGSNAGNGALRTDGTSGFRLDWNPLDYSSQFGIADNCFVAEDMNSDGAADIILTDATATHPTAGSLYVLMGHPTVNTVGSGSLEQAVSLPAGATTTYRIEGILRADLAQLRWAEIAVRLADNRPLLSELQRSATLQLAAHSADLNDDGRVDFADFLMLGGNYGRDAAERSDGDLNEDGTVNFADFLILQQQYGME